MCMAGRSGPATSSTRICPISGWTRGRTDRLNGGRRPCRVRALIAQRLTEFVARATRPKYDSLLPCGSRRCACAAWTGHGVRACPHRALAEGRTLTPEPPSAPLRRHAEPAQGAEHTLLLAFAPT